MRLVAALLLVLWSHSALAEEYPDPVTISVRILTKYHPQELDVSTRSRVFHLTPQTYLNWQFTAPAGDDIKISVNNEVQRVYRGELRIEWDGQEYRIENRTPLEVYVAGVVIGELGAGAEPELIKAQAVLARTYALKTLLREPLSDLAYHQVFSGFDHYAQQLYPISQQTQGEVLQQGAVLADALFHAECGSAIYRAGEFWVSSDNQAAKPLPKSIAAGGRWQAVLTEDQLVQIFPDATQLRRIEQQPVQINTGDQQLPIENFRLQVNRRFGWNTIPSNEFQIRRQATGWLLQGRGRGHLVGLCQQQAGELARAGRRYEEILELFYPQWQMKRR